MRDSLTRFAARLPGWFWMVLCAACFATAGALARILVREHDVHVFWVGFVRFGVGMLLIAGPALLGAWSLRIHNKPLWVVRGITGSSGVLLFFVAVAYVGVGRGTVLTYLMSLFGAVSGIYILKERPSNTVFAAVLLGTVGVLMACSSGIPQGAEWAPLGAALLSGVTLSLVRRLRRTDTNVVALFSQTVFGTLLLVGPAMTQQGPTGAATWALLLVMCLIDTCGTLTMTQGLSMLPVARGGALMMLTPVFALIAGAVFLNEWLTPRQSLGCALVISASLIAVIARASPPPSIPGRTPAPRKAAPPSQRADAER